MPSGTPDVAFGDDLTSSLSAVASSIKKADGLFAGGSQYASISILFTSKSKSLPRKTPAVLLKFDGVSDT